MVFSNFLKKIRFSITQCLFPMTENSDNSCVVLSICCFVNLQQLSDLINLPIFNNHRSKTNILSIYINKQDSKVFLLKFSTVNLTDLIHSILLDQVP